MPGDEAGGGLKLALEHEQVDRLLVERHAAGAGEEVVVADLGQLDAVEAESVPGMFWTARCWAAALAIQERTPEVVRDATIVRSLVTRCVALDETYDHAGPLVLQGALDAVTPQVMGGGVEVAQARYERAMELQKGRHLLTRVMYARDVLAPLKERELFRQTLQQVVTADPDEDPDLALLSRVAQRRALLFRGSEHLFFDMQ